MEHHQAQLILDHLDIVKHFAKGGALEFISHTCTGEECDATPVLKGIVINCLPNYRKVDRFIELPPKKYCYRWCPNNLTKGKEMINAKEALAKTNQVRETMEYKEIEKAKSTIENLIAPALNHAISKGDVCFQCEISQGGSDVVISMLKNLGYGVNMDIDDEEDDECPAILTITF